VLTRTIAEKLAGNMLAHNGIAAIWDLHLAAVAAKDAGKTDIAASLVEIAEAAERIWATRDGSQPDLDQ